MPDEPIQAVKIDFPGSRPQSKGPLGGTNSSRNLELNQPSKSLNERLVNDRAAMKQKSLQFVSNMTVKEEKLVISYIL